MSLAIGSYSALRALNDASGLLNLAWTLDEQICLRVDVRAVVADELRAEVDQALSYVGRYLVQDPYGEAELGSAVAGFHGYEPPLGALTCGAGVGPLLHALSGALHNGVLYVASDVYPDAPHWAVLAGAECTTRDRSAPDRVSAHLRALSARPPSMILLERPALTGSCFDDLDALRELCHAATRMGSVVLVDESNANYCPAGFSAVPLTASEPALVVLRGMSKAYGLGGIRLGYGVAGSAAAEFVRTYVPPLQPSSLSVRLARRVLELGDITEPLRVLIAERRRQTMAVLDPAEFSARPAAPGLPYVLLAGEASEPLARLAGLGVQGKAHPVWSAEDGALRRVGRLSVPLHPDRLAELRRLLATAET
jgi:histidinol-phosphate/aromatic aminotransferase/cobyric acid decarboxylase-like protein